MSKVNTPWWRPIETGGSLSCNECPYSILNRPEVADLQGTIRALENEIARYQIEIDRLLNGE